MASSTKDAGGPYFATKFPHPGEAQLKIEIQMAMKSSAVVVGPVPEMSPPWEWTKAMLHWWQCEACEYDGRAAPLSWRQPCYGRQRSHYMRA